MAEKDYKLYGTKVLNLKTQEIGLLICVWKTGLQIKQLILQLVLISKANGITLN